MIRPLFLPSLVGFILKKVQHRERREREEEEYDSAGWIRPPRGCTWVLSMGVK